MDFIAALFLFWLKAFGLILFIVLGWIVILVFVGRLKARSQKGILAIEDITKEFSESRKELEAALYDKKELMQLAKERKKEEKAKKKVVRKKLYVLEFKGDIQAHEASNLAETIDALLQVIKEEDQVLLKLESPGGAVHSYGYAAAQLARVRAKGSKLTVAVDKVAASGGYLMAVVANEIIASPFAIIGSIGVVAQLPNFHRFLKDKGVDFEQITAGEYKRTLTMFGENTPKEREKVKEQLELIHDQFQSFIVEYRPQVDLQEVATGEYWLAKHALALHLVDKLQVSEDFILLAYQQDYEIYKISYLRKKSLGGKMQELFMMFLPKNYF